MKRHIEREKAMICLYQHLLTNREMKEIVEDIYLMKFEEVSDYVKTITLHTQLEKERFIKYIDSVMTDWTFERLGFIEQSILLLACTEFEKGLAPDAVIIDEAIILAKKYADDKAYKLINSVLEKL